MEKSCIDQSFVGDRVKAPHTCIDKLCLGLYLALAFYAFFIH